MSHQSQTMSNTVSAMWSNWRSVINEKKIGGSLDLGDIIAFSLVVLVVLGFQRAAKKSRVATRLPPGPRGLPLIGYLPFLGADLHRDFANLASVYGPIFKFWLGNKLCVVITSPSLVKEVVRDQDTTFANRDPTVSGLIVSYGGHDIAFSSYGPDWKKMRKIFVREMLNNNILDNLYGLRRDEVKKSVRHIYEKINTPVDMGSLTFLTAINVIMSMSYGASIQGESAVISAADIKKAAAELMRLLGKPNVSDLFPSLARFDLQGIERDTKKVHRVFEEMFDSTIENRKKMVAAAKVKGGENSGDEKKRKDFLQFLLELHESEDSETSLSSAELKAMVTDTVLGATDTTATTVEWLMAELLSHPKAMRKVYEELNEVVGLNNSVEEFHLSKLTYMNAVIKETFRLHPPLPFLLPRFPSKSTTISGYTIPKGTKIFLNIWAIQRDPSIWENPNEFIPERFLTVDGSQIHYNSSNSEYIPFGSGRRICAGIPLAERIVIYILASFLHLFDWKLPPGEKLDLSDKFGIVLKKRDTLIAIPKPRFSNLELYT